MARGGAVAVAAAAAVTMMAVASGCGEGEGIGGCKGSTLVVARALGVVGRW